MEGTEGTWQEQHTWLSDTRQRSQEKKMGDAMKIITIQKLLCMNCIPAALLAGLVSLPLQSAHADDDEDEGSALNTPFKHAPRPIIGALRKPLDKLPQIEHFQVVGHTIITNPGQVIERGRNGAVQLAESCAYVGNRLGRRSGTGPAFGTPALPPEIAIVDVGNPRNPIVIGHLVTPAGGTTRELRALPERNTLIVQNFGADNTAFSPPVAPVNNFMFYNISNCSNPILKHTLTLPAAPHEFLVWVDPANPFRTLIYASFIGADPEIRVYDVSNALNNPPTSPPTTELASFSLAPAVPSVVPFNPADPALAFAPDQFPFTTPASIFPLNNRAHSFSVNKEGTRLYVANLDAGFYILDTSNLANAVTAMTCIPKTVTVDATSNTNPHLCLRKLNPDPDARVDWHPPTASVTHTALKVPGRPYVLVSDERNGTNTCPWAWGRIIDISSEFNPVIIASWLVPENLAANCFIGGPGDPAHQREFSSHQITALPNLFFQSWYSAGLRAWDISNPWLPSETGVFVPKPEFPNVVEPFRNSPDVWIWPYPVIRDRLIYQCDENSGLFILRYKGARADEVPEVGTFTGNLVRP